MERHKRPLACPLVRRWRSWSASQMARYATLQGTHEWSCRSCRAAICALWRLQASVRQNNRMYATPTKGADCITHMPHASLHYINKPQASPLTYQCPLCLRSQDTCTGMQLLTLPQDMPRCFRACSCRCHWRSLLACPHLQYRLWCLCSASNTLPARLATPHCTQLHPSGGPGCPQRICISRACGSRAITGCC